MDNKQNNNRPQGGNKGSDTNRQTEDFPGNLTEDETKDAQPGGQGTGAMGDDNRRRPRPGDNQPVTNPEGGPDDEEMDEENQQPV